MNEAKAVAGTLSKIMTLADGTWRLQIDLHEKPPFDLLEVHQELAISRLHIPTDGTGVQNGPYSGMARELYRTGFFNRPAIWAAIGTTLNEGDPEKAFRQRLSEEKCWLKDSRCEGDVVCAHVSLTETTTRGERVGAHGTATKARFSAVPLCDWHHRKQHEKGYKHFDTLDSWRKARLQYVSDWAADALKAWLGFDHWYNCPPGDLAAWAAEQGPDIFGMLPTVIRQEFS